MASRTCNKRLSSFCKQYLPKHGPDGLEIPDAFVENLNGFPKKVVLQNSVGRVWHLEIGYTDSGVFFLNGWQKFVIDNSVEKGDYLVFGYDRDHSFDIIVFGKSACEKRETGDNGGIKKEVKMEEEVKDDTVVIDVDYHHGGENDNIQDHVQEKEEQKDTEDEAESLARTIMMHRGKKIVGKKGGFKKPVAHQGFDARNYVQPQNPYFVLKPSHKKDKHDRLFVPSAVLKNFKLELAEDIIFLDEHRRKWRGKVVRWRDGRIKISGWTNVSTWNYVGKNDLCIFEFPKGEGTTRDTIEVHIVRGFGSGSQSQN